MTGRITGECTICGGQNGQHWPWCGHAARAGAVTAVTAVTHITTRQDMASWTRAHAAAPGIHWSVQPGPGGTLLIIEHAHDRAGTARPAASAATTKEAA